MNFTTAITTCLSKYATFSGRASRSEFWWFVLFMVLANVGASWVSSATGEDVGLFIEAVVWFGLILPTLAVGCRRLHDIGRSGWWQLLLLIGIGTLVLIVWWVFGSQPEDNAYGPGPASAALPVAA